MVLIVLMLPVVLVAGYMVFASAKLTSAKMEVQNAADAAAFSVSTLEARDLNFMAYTNRAMVANDIGIAQLVGLMSWADSLASVRGQLNTINRNTCPRLGFPGSLVCSTFFGALETYYGVLGRGAKTVLRTIGRLGVSGINLVNQRVYGNAQFAYHGVTVYLLSTNLLGGGLGGALANVTPGEEPIVLKAIADNAPGARLSPVGTIALAGHLLYYAGDFFPGLLGRINETPFLKTYNPTSTAPEDTEGFQAFAAIQRESRDEFLQSRGNAFPGGPGRATSREQEAIRQPLDCPFPSPFDVIPCGRLVFPVGFDFGQPVGRIGFDLVLSIDFGIEFGTGGSELRYRRNAAGNQFYHSAIDRSRASVDIGAYALIPIPAPLNVAGCPLVLFNPLIFFDRQGDCILAPAAPLVNEFFLAFGMAQDGGRRPRYNIRRRQLFTSGRADFDRDFYNGSANDFPNGPFFGSEDNLPIQGVGVNIFPQPAPPGERYTDGEVKLTRYDGLPKHTNVTNPVETPEEAIGFKAPFYLVGVVKTINPEQEGLLGTISSRYATVGPPGYVNEPDRPEFGRLANAEGDVGPQLLDRSTDLEGAANQVAAIAKSEVYFARPTSSRFFARSDGRTEFGNAFSPYWQARLVKTSDLDRSLGLLGQQGVPWFPQVTAIFQNVFGALGFGPGATAP